MDSTMLAADLRDNAVLSGLAPDQLGLPDFDLLLSVFRCPTCGVQLEADLPDIVSGSSDLAAFLEHAKTVKVSHAQIAHACPEVSGLAAIPPVPVACAPIKPCSVLGAKIREALAGEPESITTTFLPLIKDRGGVPTLEEAQELILEREEQGSQGLYILLMGHSRENWSKFVCAGGANTSWRKAMDRVLDISNWAADRGHVPVIFWCTMTETESWFKLFPAGRSKSFARLAMDKLFAIAATRGSEHDLLPTVVPMYSEAELATVGQVNNPKYPWRANQQRMLQIACQAASQGISTAMIWHTGDEFKAFYGGSMERAIAGMRSEGGGAKFQLMVDYVICSLTGAFDKDPKE